MEEGFIISNKMHKALFVEIASGETSLIRIIKKHRLVKQAAYKALEKLIDHEFIEEIDGNLRMTEKGIKLYGKLRANDSL